MEHGAPSRAETRGSRCLHSDEAHFRVVEEACEEPDRVRASADACDDGVRKTLVGIEHLRACLASDHRLQLSTMLGYGAGPTHDPMR